MAVSQLPRCPMVSLRRSSALAQGGEARAAIAATARGRPKLIFMVFSRLSRRLFDELSLSRRVGKAKRAHGAPVVVPSARKAHLLPPYALGWSGGAAASPHGKTVPGFRCAQSGLQLYAPASVSLLFDRT